ncbi:Tn3 family transposase [Streptomyces geranii]|uniref:Tn3 family transposase n=1 Tax=Streptomyces geranii TaxID=2058923 RepID=UPI0013002EAD
MDPPHTTLDLVEVIRELWAEGWQITGEDLAAISPYLTDHIMRFGSYATTELTACPDALDPHLDVDFDAEEEPAASRPSGCTPPTASRRPAGSRPVTSVRGEDRSGGSAGRTGGLAMHR